MESIVATTKTAEDIDFVSYESYGMCVKSTQGPMASFTDAWIAFPAKSSTKRHLCLQDLVGASACIL